ncbi:hypothetical protein [Nonomuraea sp. NPDC002799]
MDYDGLEFLRASGWQNADENHPAGKGHSGYRIVWRSLAWMVYPEAVFGFSNMRIRIGVGDVDIGGMVLTNAVPMREHGQWILPQEIHSSPPGEQVTFRSKGPEVIEFKAWQETVTSISFVEMLMRTESNETKPIAVEGRKATASMLTLLQFSFGHRVAAVPLAEEVGEVFPDWHWNRSLASDSLAWEPQLDLQGETATGLRDTLKPLIDNWLSRRESKRSVVRIACQWWQLAAAQSDLAIKYITLWLVAEALLDRTHMATRLHSLLGCSPGMWKKLIDRLYSRRCRLAHGEDREADEMEIAEMRCLAGVLLSAELCATPLPTYATQLKKLVSAAAP